MFKKILPLSLIICLILSAASTSFAGKEVKEEPIVRSEDTEVLLDISVLEKAFDAISDPEMQRKIKEAYFTIAYSETADIHYSTIEEGKAALKADEERRLADHKKQVEEMAQFMKDVDKMSKEQLEANIASHINQYSEKNRIRQKYYRE